MPQFFYEAVDTSGKTVVGKLEAADVQEVQNRLRMYGYTSAAVAPVSPIVPSVSFQPQQQAPAASAPAPLSWNTYPADVASPSSGTPPATPPRQIILTGNAVRSKAPKMGVAPASSQPKYATSQLGGVNAHDLLFFFQQFGTLIQSGHSLHTALDDLSQRVPNQNLRKTVQEMAEAARTGRPISDVMRRYPRIFPEHIAAAVGAGELGGFLDIILPEIAQTYAQNIALYRGSWVAKTMAISSLYGLALVIPFFGDLFHSMNFSANMRLYILQEVFFYLPAATAIVLLSRWLFRWAQRPEFREKLDSIALHLPPFGDLQRQFSLACFVRTLRRLYHAGIAPGSAWESAVNTTPNAAIRARLRQANELMQRGASLADAFQATNLFTGQMEYLIITGHQAGRVVESLDQMADYYQNLVLDASGKVRFAILRLGILAMLVLGGASLLWFVHSYFAGMFHWVDTYFGTN